MGKEKEIFGYGDMYMIFEKKGMGGRITTGLKDCGVFFFGGLFVFDFFLGFKNPCGLCRYRSCNASWLSLLAKKTFFFFTLLDFLEWNQGEPKCSASNNHPTCLA